MKGWLWIPMFVIVLWMPGCIRYNGSPIHTQLTVSELRGEVRSRFTLGMTSVEVEQALDRLSLPHGRSFVSPESDVVVGIMASLQKPGFRVKKLISMDPYSMDTLWFRLAPESGLARVKYTGSLQEEADEQVEERSGEQVKLTIELAQAKAEPSP